MPEEQIAHVVVKLWPGKTEKQKARLAHAIAGDVIRLLHYGEGSVSVAIEEISAGDWGEKVCLPDIVKESAQFYRKPGYTM